MRAVRPRFITFEGIEGAGKSTQIALAAQALQHAGISNVVTREPGGTPLAEAIRDLVLNPHDGTPPPMTELLLMFAARAAHLSQLIEPALARGDWVLCDRFTDATYAYQGAGRGISRSAIESLEHLVQGSRRPDLTFLLDLPAEAGLRRAAARGRPVDRFESEKLEFFHRVRQGYLERAQAESGRFRIIDASLGTAQVQESVENAMNALMVQD